MRIRELQLIAFGRFTDVTLDFAADAGRLSIVYGPNEAGKSTALRAISALLFGIPGQTDDDYLHQYGAMRIGAVLARGDGAVGHFVRRKGNKDTLLDADGSPVIEDRVRDFLGGMDRERFMAAFALDHETLRMGGQELLEGRGDVGESLFAGATGIVGIRRLRQQLEEDAGKIWKPRAQSLPLAEAMKHLDEARKLRSGDTLSARQWKEVTDRVEGLERECTGLRERRAALESASRRIERRLAAMPKVRERALLLQERGELGDVILLPSGATSERERAERNKRDASDLIVEASDAIKGLRAKLEALSPPDAWLKAEGSIEGLNGPYGAYVKAMNDVPLRRAEADRSRREAAGRLRDVRPDLTLNDAESLRLSMQTRAKIESLADEGTRLSLECSTAREECRKAEGEATDLEARLTGMQAVADPSNLRACLQSEREHAADERELPGLQAKRKHEAEQIGVEQRRIGLAGRDLQEVDALPVPSAEAIEDLRSQLDAAGRRQDDAEKEVGRARADLAGTERDIEALRSAGEVPLEADLDEARGRREAGWRLVRASWLDACADPEAERAYDPDRPLAEAYEASVGHADVIADRLRREAERVARLASLTARKQGLQQQLEQAEREASDRSDELEEVRRKWVAAWAPSGIEPQSPSAMRAWLAGLNRLRQSIADVHDLDRDVALRREMVDLARAKLIEAVAAVVPKPSFGPNDSFSSIVAMSEGLVRALDDAIRERKDAQERLRERRSALDMRRRDLQEAEQDLAAWEGRWREAVAPLGLGDMPEPSLVESALARLGEMFANLKEADGEEERVRGMLDDADRLGKDVRKLAADLLPGSDESEWTDLLADMKRRLQLAREDANNRKHWSQQLADLEAKHKQAKAALEAADAELARLLQQAQVADRDHLPEAERRSDRACEIAEKLNELERELGRMCGDEDRETFVAEVEVTSEEEARLEQIGTEAEISDVESQLSEKLPALGEARSERRRMDGGSGAADAAEEEQQAMAEVHRHVEQYVLTRLAAEILDRAIDDMRERNQAPVLRRSGELFSRLTAGRYTGLEAGQDAKGRDEILGRLADGRQVKVEHMSDGTRDQLFLALRLAATEARTGAEPMPLILDDALINFDDRRAQAALEVLGELAATTQVLLFTHHARMVELADGAGVHELQA